MNRLKDSTSLYLRQHADNPVDWQPWDEKALAMAKEQSRPILLSIGYSACHWCHVMAHESFEDPVTAEVMNRLYVNIKLDREERPDLDKLYQLSHQLLSNRGGGWPLTVFLDPDDLTPFFAGTYFPPQPRHGLPAFTELLEKIRSWFDENRDAVNTQNQRLKDAISSLQEASGFDGEPDRGIFTTAFEQVEQRYDRVHGGFGGAPKFPQAPLLGLLNELAMMSEPFADKAAAMLGDSLEKMAMSGLRDHLDGGFFRYTVDGSWTIPHFEKMLYDNAMLLPLYAETAARTGSPLLKETAEGIAGWLESQMQDENGGFYASVDADADGVEGGFHVWDPDELTQLLEEDEYETVARCYGLDQPPNFEGKHWHLVRTGHQPADPKLLHRAKQKMLAARQARIPPATDTKQLASWNAMCIEGFARAGLAMERQDWIETAQKALDFVRENLWENGRLFAVHSDGKTRFCAYLDDHACLINATLSLLSARWDAAAYLFALQLAESMLDQFEDADSGGFFFSAADQQAPVARLRPLQDDATPGGNGLAVIALESLGHLAAEPRYLDSASRALMSAYSDFQQHPLAHATLLVALNRHLAQAIQVIITGPDDAESHQWKKLASAFDRVNCYVFGLGNDGPHGDDLPGPPGLYTIGEQTTAFVCEGLRCLPPVKSDLALKQLLESMV